jgi:predicted RNase H-like HicB family nuclease
MLKNHAAYYREDSGWLFVTLLDFPGVNSQGRNLREARAMIKDALAFMAETYLDQGRSLPTPDRKAHDEDAEFEEEIALVVRAKAIEKS